jgi:hypothetical protein
MLLLLFLSSIFFMSVPFSIIFLSLCSAKIGHPASAQDRVDDLVFR